MWLPFECPLLGTWLATQACALTGNRTSNPLICRPALNPLSCTSGGDWIIWITETWGGKRQLRAVLYLVSGGWVAFNRQGKTSKQLNSMVSVQQSFITLTLGHFIHIFLSLLWVASIRKLKLSQQKEKGGALTPSLWSTKTYSACSHGVLGSEIPMMMISQPFISFHVFVLSSLCISSIFSHVLVTWQEKWPQTATDYILTQVH